MVGYPRMYNKTTDKRINDREVLIDFEGVPACLPIEQIPYTEIERLRQLADLDDMWKDSRNFFARILPFADDHGSQPEDIDFMSGGMVVSIENPSSGPMRYRLFGIQCRWVKSKRIICAISMDRVEPLIAEWSKQP